MTKKEIISEKEDTENEYTSELLDILSDFEVDNESNYIKRQLPVISIEKYILGMKDMDDIEDEFVVEAMKETNGELCIRYDDKFGHGYIGLVLGDVVRLMQPNASDSYNGPFNTSISDISEWFDNGNLKFIPREETPFDGSQAID